MTADPDVIEIETPHGLARAQLEAAADPIGALALGHGAGGGVAAPDLVVASEAARAAGFTVALVEQPYKVAGKRSQPAASRLDEAWSTVLAHLGSAELEGLPLVSGGRSAGARVACRTAAESGAAGVLCLAFPVHPPGKPEKTRMDELDSVEVPVLVVQGTSDPFGMPTESPGRELVKVAGNHSLKGDLEAVRAAVGGWLAGLSL